jgi:hypothetical protein
MYLENLIIKCRKCGGEDFKITHHTDGGCGDPECCGETEYYGITVICKKCKSEDNIDITF